MFSKLQKKLKPVIFGEVLFDQFDDSVKTLGGAPFNVACHLQGFGANPHFISRIGSDESGNSVLRAMADWNMDTTGVQKDGVLPTGTVHVSLHQGCPSFEIPAGQAWDSIVVPDQLPRYQAALLYHGTLALRSEKNMGTVDKIKEILNPFVFVDINLRSPWWNHELVMNVFRQAAAIKLSIEELKVILNAPSNIDYEELFEKARVFFDNPQLKFIVVTRGAEGAVLLESTDGNITCFKPEPVDEIVDTVGAGDAFSAVVALGIISGWSLHETMKRAAECAAHICSIRGAVVFDNSFYHDLLVHWGWIGS